MHEMNRPPRADRAFPPWQTCRSRPHWWLAWRCGFVLASLSACVSLPASYAELRWSDHWGDRGRGVLERDFVMCSGLVETRRSQLSACMAARGWSLQ
jgi:hypothetical protein